MLIQQESLHHIAVRCRERNTPVVVGGPYLSTSPEKRTGVEHILCGEAETLLKPFLEDLARDRGRRIQGPSSPPGRMAAQTSIICQR